MKEITITLGAEQYSLVHKVAQLQDMEPWQLVLGYIQMGLNADTEAYVYEVLPFPRNDLNGIIKTFAAN